ncbi:hypothetical protein BD413DRAFT_608173 [Trametes elegans]|nr:hypothetical protein BD413DRAFT_608173 [Trametes elegans]
MGLLDHHKSFQKFINVFETQGKKYLDRNLPPRRQDPERWQQYIQSLTKRLTSFGRYEAAWPATVFIQIKYRRLRNRNNAQNRRQSVAPVRAADSCGANSAPLTSSRTLRTVPPTPSRDGRREPSREPPTSRHAQELSPAASGSPQRLLDPPAPSVSTATQRTNASLTARAATPETSARPPARAALPARQAAPPLCFAPGSAPSSVCPPAASWDSGTPDAVHAFLNSLALPLGRLLPAFRALGVVDHAALRVLARMPDRSAWLHRHLVEDGRFGVREFQFKLIMDGLARLPGALKLEE